MFVGLKHPLVKGETVKATLSFEHAGPSPSICPVVGGPPAPAAGRGRMKGMKM